MDSIILFCVIGVLAFLLILETVSISVFIYKTKNSENQVRLSQGNIYYFMFDFTSILFPHIL